MKSVCLKRSLVSRVGASVATGSLFLTLASSALAQSATSSSKGGTSSSLPSAGSVEITYAIFIAGSVLFILGAIKFFFTLKD